MTKTTPRWFFRTVTATILTMAAATAVAETLPGDNPFARPSPLPYQVPDFARIKDTDYLPALMAGIAAAKTEVAAIADHAARPTFDNTIKTLEMSGMLLSRTNYAFNLIAASNTSETIQKTQRVAAPLLAAHKDFIYLNPKLFARVKYLHAHGAQMKFSAEQQRVVELYYRQFVHAGAALGPEAQAELRAVNRKLSERETEFDQKLLAASNSGAVYFDDIASLAGLTPQQLSAAESAARKMGRPGYLLQLTNTTQPPLVESLSVHETRRELFEASVNRARKGDANDTRGIVGEIARLRAQKAAIFGVSSYADYILYDQMAGNRAAAAAFLNRLAPAVSGKQEREADDIRRLAKAGGADFEPTPADWNFYAEQIRRDRFSVDREQLMQYFEFDKVLKDGVFFAATQLYGITFKERKDLPTWNADVRVFEVFDHNGRRLAIYMIDPWKRPNKGGGAWMSNVVPHSGLYGTKPVVANVENFAKPPAGQPALVSWDDVNTMFHEFGHALHVMFTSQYYPMLCRPWVARDFFEFPSQFNENWALDPIVLRHYAVHHQTGEPLPGELVQKILDSRTFNQGYALGEILEAAKLDLDWHSISAGDSVADMDMFEADALAKSGYDVVDVPPRYHSTYFRHVWSMGYAAGYYAYPWSRTLAQDAFDWFEAHGGLTRANGQRFRDMVLSRGNSAEYSQMYRAFAGHAPAIEPFLKYYGLPVGGGH